jgi:hypothetical protein
MGKIVNEWKDEVGLYQKMVIEMIMKVVATLGALDINE